MPDGGIPIPKIHARVVKSGEHLGLELPADVIEKLGLHEGDFVDVSTSDGALPLVIRKLDTDELFERIKAMRGLLPSGYRFKRDDAYDAE